MSRREDRAEATRAQLVAAGTELFAEHGYADVGTEDLVRRAGVTRGALYHHFADKRELFAAVYERLEGDLVARIGERIAESVAATDTGGDSGGATRPGGNLEGATGPGGDSGGAGGASAGGASDTAGATGAGADPIELLTTGVRAFLDEVAQPAVVRIGLLDAPTVLGWARWREVGEHYGLGLVISTLEYAMATGALRRQPVRPLALLVLAALGEAAQLIAHADDPAEARAEVEPALLALIAGLRA